MSSTSKPAAVDTAIVTAVVVILLAAAIIAAVVSASVHNTGTINTVGFALWQDANRTTILASINWGTFNPGDIHGVVGYAQNTGDTNITLAYQTYNWTPPTAQQYLVFGWNYTAGTLIGPGSTVPIMLTLEALPNVTGITTFSFDTTMNATQT